jgi:hypothetical protein
MYIDNTIGASAQTSLNQGILFIQICLIDGPELIVQEVLPPNIEAVIVHEVPHLYCAFVTWADSGETLTMGLAVK